MIENSRNLLLSVPVLSKLPRRVFSSNNVDCFLSLVDFGAIAKLMLRHTSETDTIECVVLGAVNDIEVTTTRISSRVGEIRFLLVESTCAD
jgi:hypothetical protein